MSDDGCSDLYVPDYEEPTIEICIETLTGTTFEMTVSPTDTIISIKSKIQRVEGIPISQQHLLHRLQELNNDDRLCDHGVASGSTLRLVLSMRGGPISTRRLASSEHHLAWRELKEYVDNTREDMIEKLPPGAKVTVLLFRDGENINLIRVIENEDGTCYPYSDAWVPSHSRSSKDSAQAKYKERTMENNVMMHKVIELRRKMEGLSMQRKAKKPNAPQTAGSSEGSSYEQPSTSGLNNVAEDLLENIRLHAENGDSEARIGKTVSEMYSDRLLLLEQRRNARSNIGRTHRAHRVDTSLSKSDDMPMSSRNCSSIQAPSIAILEEEPESSLLSDKKDTNFSPPSPISVPSGDANTITMSQIPSLPGTSRNLLHLTHVPVVLQDHSDRPKTSPDNYDQKAQEFCNVLFNDAAKRSHNSVNSAVKLSVSSNRRQSLDYASNKTTNLPRMQYASSSNSRIDTLDTKWQSSNLLTSQYASTSKLNLNSPAAPKTADRRSAIFGRRARITPEKYGYSNLGYLANIEKIQNNQSRRSMNFVSNLESRTTNDPTSYELRPIKLPRRRQELATAHEEVASSTGGVLLPEIVPKKTSRTRCAFCNKRLNITTVHTCRCGGVFCSQHRYSEVHGCHYDYKTEGRKILEQANPLVAAPKLPKI